MARRPRIIGEYLHVIVRGIGKQILFESDEDRRKYLSFLRKYGEETEMIFLAYCIMENHVHLLVNDRSQNIAVFMKKVGVSYAQYYNKKYERTGHLFQDRYKSEIVKNDAQFLSVYRYILNNPSKAGICPANEYRWSSYHDFDKPYGLTATHELRKIIGKDAVLSTLLSQSDDTEVMEEDGPRHDDEWAISLIKKALNIRSCTELQKYNRQQRDTALAELKMKGVSIRQLERLTGINRGVIQKAKVVKENRPH